MKSQSAETSRRQNIQKEMASHIAVNECESTCLIENSIHIWTISLDISLYSDIMRTHGITEDNGRTYPANEREESVVNQHN